MFVLSVLLGLFDEEHTFFIINIILLILIPELKKVVIKTRSPDTIGKKILFSKIGYIFFGITISLFLIGFLFNLIYRYEAGGIMDFRDFGFQVFSLPLSSILQFEVDQDKIISRLTLYFITLINLGILIFLVDFFGFIISKIGTSFRKIIK